MPGVSVIIVRQDRLRKINEENIRRRRLRDASNPLEMSETAFIALYRVNQEAFVMILNEVAPFIIKTRLQKILQLAATLRFLAVGGFQGVVANDLNISFGRSTMCKVLWRVINILEAKLCPKWIALVRNQQQIAECKTYFLEKFGIPGVLGCVDGTHIRMIEPEEDKNNFRNRKGYFGINVMIICDHNMRILAVDGRRPGSCHDSFIWSLSDARLYYQRKLENGEQNGWLLGDSGYGLEPFLMTPYRNPRFGSNEHRFNRKHCAARNIVERTIGNLKSRFRCLQNYMLVYDPPKVVKLVNVCSALHNICKAYNIDDGRIPELYQDNNDDADEDNEREIFDNEEAEAIRNNIANGLVFN